MEFREWITRKYIDWRGDAIGNDRSITDFAKMIGISHQVMGNWMNGAIPNRKATVDKLVAVYPDAKQILGIEDQDQFPPDFVALVERARLEAEAELSRLGLASGSVEGLKIVTSTFEKYGFTYKRTFKE